MPDLPLTRRMDRTLHPFCQNNIEEAKNQTSHQILRESMDLLKEYKDQNDHNGKIYRCKTSFD